MIITKTPAMKNIRTFFLLILSFLFAQGIVSQDIDYQKIGDNVAATVATVEPGETVLIYGGEYNLRLMEAIAVGVHKRGALPFLNIVTNKTELSFLTDVPEEHFLTLPDPMVKWIEDVDVMIVISPEIENAAEWEKRKDELSESMQKSMEERGALQYQALMEAKTRVIIFNYPTIEKAQLTGMDLETYTAEWMKGLSADFEKVRATGKSWKKCWSNPKRFALQRLLVRISLSKRPEGVAGFWMGVRLQRTMKNP